MHGDELMMMMMMMIYLVRHEPGGISSRWKLIDGNCDVRVLSTATSKPTS